MATGGMSESLRGSSDEVFELECGLCINDDKHIEANHYCHNCQSYICEACKAIHSRIPALCQHQISPIQNDCGLCLAEGRKIKATSYCKTCKSYICDTCKGSHKKFKDLRCHVIVPDQLVTSSSDVRGTSNISVQFSHLSTGSDSPACSSSNPRSARQSSLMSTKSVDSVDGARPSTTVPSTDTTSQKQTKSLADMAVRTSNKININIENDRSTPWITGCCFMPGGELVLCDYDNHNIKLLSKSLTLQDSLALHSAPWDVADLDCYNIAVTLPLKKQVQIIQLLPTVKIGRTISVDMKCYGIAVAGDEIYVSGTVDAGNGQVNAYDVSWNFRYKIYDIRWELKWRLGVDQDGVGLFSVPYYIAVSQAGGRVFVADFITDTVTCLSSGGQVVGRYKDDTLKYLGGLYVDSHDNIIVCTFQYWHNSVGIITAEGKMYKTLTQLSYMGCLSTTYMDRIVHPRSVTFRPDDQTLVVCCDDSDEIYVYTLS